MLPGLLVFSEAEELQGQRSFPWRGCCPHGFTWKPLRLSELQPVDEHCGMLGNALCFKEPCVPLSLGSLSPDLAAA